MGFTEANILARVDWTSELWTLRTDVVVEPFDAGQFVNVAVEREGQLVKRSYSLASAPGEPAELLLVLVPDGVVTPRLSPLGVGDRLMMTTHGTGFFTLAHVPDARDLWLVATGTGLAPYLSMLRHGEPFERFERVMVVHAVRKAADLVYREELERFAADRPLLYLPVVSREDHHEALRGRVPALLREGLLERRAGHQVTSRDSHVMLCGNPHMIRDTLVALRERGLEKHRRRKPGHITVEKYW